METIRSLQPHVLVNNRLDMDVEPDFKTPEMLVQMLVNHVSRGGNLLMNVGPIARGEFDYRAIAALEVYGDWMKYHSRSIYGCGEAPEGFMLQLTAVILIIRKRSASIYIFSHGPLSQFI